MKNATSELLGNYAARISPLPFIALEPGLDGKFAACLQAVGNFRDPLLVADENTLKVMGNAVAEGLGLTATQLYTLMNGVHADMEISRQIASKAAGFDIIIAVGSGTINDLCKYAAYLANVPYICFATAPSMNGYVSATASLIKNGLKTSHAAKMPLGVFCDMRIMVSAPYRLIRSGIGDTLCRSTVQADWLLSHLLLDTKYDEVPFELLKPYEDILIKKAALFPAHEPQSIMALTKALMIGGFGMVMCGGSYPASQGEHIIAHALEMKYPERLANSYHGEQIAVTTLIMEKLQREIVDREEAPSSSMTNHKLSSRLKYDWGSVRQTIKSVMLPQGILEKAMKDAGVPVHCEDIGISDAELREAVKIAPSLRERFGFLSLS